MYGRFLLPNEQDVVAVVLGAFRHPQPDSSTAPLPFTLVSLGGTNLKRKALGVEGETRNLTLSQIGLSPPAATLLLQWKGKGGEDAVFPKAGGVVGWVGGWGLLVLRRRAMLTIPKSTNEPV